MKKILLIISAICILFLTGCNVNEETNDATVENSGDQKQEVNLENSDSDEAGDIVEDSNEENSEEDIKEENGDAVEETAEKDVVEKTIEQEIIEHDGKVLMTNNSYIVDWAIGGVDPEEYTGNVFYINLDSESVKTFNSDFENIMKEEMNEEATMSVHKSKYYINDNILSIVVSTCEEAGGDHLRGAYNFDIETGEELRSKDILKYVGMTEEDFKGKLHKIYESEFLKQCSEWNSVEDLGDDWVLDAYNRTINDIPTDINQIDMYLDEAGNLHILTGVETVAGMPHIRFYDAVVK